MSQKGLIVVDLQRAFSPPAEMVEKIRARLPQYDLVVATQFLNRPGSIYETELNYTRCQIGSVESEIVIPLHPQAVFDRFTYGLQAPHIGWLKKQSVARWDVVGCDTEACVMATCCALWDNQIRVSLIEALCQ